MCISAYHFTAVLSLLLPCIVIYFLHLLSTNHKCTQPCYFLLLPKPTAQKEKVDWNSSTRISRLCVTLVAIPMLLWSLPLFRFVESHFSL
jgi:MFS-type transporter involved in bile tolerance (Atg22 family)